MFVRHSPRGFATPSGQGNLQGFPDVIVTANVVLFIISNGVETVAYMNQERKATLAAALRAALVGSGLKYTLAVRNHSTLCMNITSGPVDFIGDRTEKGPAHNTPRDEYLDINPYWYREHFTGKSLEILTKIFNALNIGNHDRSDMQSDYFDVGWYVDVNVGHWNKPYTFTGCQRPDCPTCRVGESPTCISQGIELVYMYTQNEVLPC